MQHTLEEDLYLINIPAQEENPVQMMQMQSMSDI